jgi:membrane protease YdiL (CAAX protease family)
MLHLGTLSRILVRMILNSEISIGILYLFIRCSHIYAQNLIRRSRLGLLLFIFLYGFAQGLSRPTHISWLNDIISIAWVILIIATYFGTVRLFEKRKADEFRMSKLLPQVGIGLLVGIGFFVVVVGAMALCGIYKVTAVHWNFYSLFTQLLLFLSVAVCEEVIFRGILFRFIDSRWNT